LVTLASAATRPHYGGTLRIELRAQLASLDPVAPETSAEAQAAKEHVASLIFDPLVRMDDKGAPQPALALTWQHSPDFKSWQFTLRPNVKFHDGTPCTTRTAVESLLRVPNPHWRVRAEGNDVLVYEADSALPNLLAELAQPKYAITHGSGGSVSGTGPFQLSSSYQPGKQLVLKANDDYWDARPYLDSVQITLGRSLRDQMVDLELGRADVIEVGFDQARRAAQEGKRVVTSMPTEVFVLVFNSEKPGVQDERLREAIADALDRAAITNVLLQKEGEPSGAVLPQWISGYAFLFWGGRNFDRALQLRAEVVIPTLIVNYDFSDLAAKAIAERVAVNAREAGINMQALGENLATRGSAAALQVVRVRYGSMDPATALLNIAGALSSVDAATVDASKFSSANSPTTLYRFERDLLSGFRVVPIAQVPETWGLSNRVRNWVEPREGGWSIPDVWLEGAQADARSEGHP
jgi:ABC-type transport system substrate-binding protein